MPAGLWVCKRSCAIWPTFIHGRADPSSIGRPLQNDAHGRCPKKQIRPWWCWLAWTQRVGQNNENKSKIRFKTWSWTGFVVRSSFARLRLLLSWAFEIIHIPVNPPLWPPDGIHIGIWWVLGVRRRDWVLIICPEFRIVQLCLWHDCSPSKANTK